MSTRSFPLLCLGLALALVATCIGCTFAAREEPFVAERPIRVLLLGDSISMGYTPIVRQQLGARAFVMRARKEDGQTLENCAGTSHGVVHLERWLAQARGGWDVIHFNFGLHDLKHVHPETGNNSDDPDDPHQAAPDLYEAQLRDLVKRLQGAGALLIFATTTPVPAGVRPYRSPVDVERYNRIACRLMKEHGIPVNDLFAFVHPRLSEFQHPQDVHFNASGSAALGEKVSQAILRLWARQGQRTSGDRDAFVAEARRDKTREVAHGGDGPPWGAIVPGALGGVGVSGASDQ